MSRTTVHIRPETLAKVREMAAKEQRPMCEIVEEAIEARRRKVFWDECNAAFAELRADPVAWAEELEERRLWDNTLMDGLEDDEYPLDGLQLT